MDDSIDTIRILLTKIKETGDSTKALALSQAILNITKAVQIEAETLKVEVETRIIDQTYEMLE